MAQHDYVVDNASGATARADINSALSAIVSSNSGTSAPSTTYAYQLWADTTNGLLKLRNAANSAWVTVGTLATIYLGLASLSAFQTWLAQQVPMNGTLTDGATIDWDGNVNGQIVSLAIGGNRTLNAPTNIKQYAAYMLRVAQDSTGSRLITWNAAFKFGTAGAPTLTTTANKVDWLMFVGGTSNTLEFLGIRPDAV